MSFLDFMQVLDTTYPRTLNEEWIVLWALGLFVGELIAFSLTAVGIYFMSKKRVSLRDSLFIALTVTFASFAWGVFWWYVIGFW